MFCCLTDGRGVEEEFPCSTWGVSLLTSNCDGAVLRYTIVQKGRIALGPTQGSADEMPAGALCKGHLSVDRHAFPRESCVESFWKLLIGVPITHSCLFSPFLSALHIVCLPASAFRISVPPLGCCLNAVDLINFFLSICDIKNAATHILVDDSGNVMQLAEASPEMSDDVLRAEYRFACWQRYLCGIACPWMWFSCIKWC